MPFKGFEGPAGTGKTFQLVEDIRARIGELAPEPHHRILALTFMNSSRRRLDDRLAQPIETRKRATALTIDAFAAHVLRRWYSGRDLLPDFANFDDVCDACGALLERPEIARWVGATFPIIAVDEAQELKPCRLRIVRALADRGQVIVAADEFQCLDDTIDTGPFLEWFGTGDVTRLDVVRRTAQRGLLDAGIALRAGRPPVSGNGFSIRYEFNNQMPFAVGHALNQARGSTAVLVGPSGTTWANQLIPRLNAGFQSLRQVVHPVRIGWEAAPSTEAQNLAEATCPAAGAPAIALSIALSGISNPPGWLRSAINSMDLSRRAHGKHFWSQVELAMLFEKKASAFRAYGHQGQRGIPVMSIHAAKNRQFRNIVVLWPPGVPGTPDYLRRLLYNAITRAEHQATVFVRTEALLHAPPFAAEQL